MTEENDVPETPLPNWKADIKRHRKIMDNFEPHDRLDYAFGLFLLFAVLGRSCQGWLQWLQNPAVIKEFKEEQLREYYTSVKEEVVKLLDIDYEATDKYEKASKRAEKYLGIINGGTEQSQSHLRYT